MSVRQLELPAGGYIFGGVAPEVHQSADGVLYVVFCGGIGSEPFGTYVYRIYPNMHVERVPLPAFTPTRAATSIRPDGLYLTWPTRNERAIIEVKVPGFVTPSGGTVAPSPTGVDQVARNDIAALRNQVSQLSTLLNTTRNEVTQLRNRVAALEARPVGLSQQQVETVAWNKSADRMYFELGNPNSGIVGRITQLVQSLVKR